MEKGFFCREKIRKKAVIFAMGSLWMGMGAWLVAKGIYWGCLDGSPGWLALGLLPGLLKGKFILGKTVRRFVLRVESKAPLRLWRYAPLLGGMMALGMALNRLPVPLLARGIVDVAVGSALVYGAFLFFTYGKEIPLRFAGSDRAARPE